MVPQDAQEMARGLMEQHGLAGWTFAFNRRRRSLGLCRYGVRRIELSMAYVLGNDAENVRDTILHEIAHGLCSSSEGHGRKWKEMCRRLGATPERLAKEVVVPAGRWYAKCPGCGQKFTRYRRPPARRKYACRRCGAEKGAIVFYLAAFEGGEKAGE